MATRFQPIKDGSTVSRVTQAVRQAIFTGDVRPGESLREAHLAREFQVSQTTVREALIQLEQASLVQRIPNRGTIVTKLTDEETRERLTIRLLLEQHAAVEAARRLTEEGFAELRRRVQVIHNALARNEYFESAQADLQFHRYIWEQSGNRTLHAELDQLCAPLFAFISIRRSEKSENLRDVVESHEAIVDALFGGDAIAIRQQIRDHIEHTYGKLIGAAPAGSTANLVRPQLRSHRRAREKDEGSSWSFFGTAPLFLAGASSGNATSLGTARTTSSRSSGLQPV